MVRWNYITYDPKRPDETKLEFGDYQGEREDLHDFLRHMPREVQAMIVWLENGEVWIWQRADHPKYAKTNNWQLAVAGPKTPGQLRLWDYKVD